MRGKNMLINSLYPGTKFKYRSTSSTESEEDWIEVQSGFPLSKPRDRFQIMSTHDGNRYSRIVGNGVQSRPR